MTEIYRAEDYRPGAGVGHLVNRVRNEMLVEVDRRLATDEQLLAIEVTAAQFVILSILNTGEARSAAALCRLASYDAGAMTRMVDRLVEKGLVRRVRNLDDRRLQTLELTERSLTALPRMREISRRVANRFLAGFSQAEARLLEELLGRMLQNTR